MFLCPADGAIPTASLIGHSSSVSTLLRQGRIGLSWGVHNILQNLSSSLFSDLCGRRPLRDQNLEVCRFADGYRLAGTQIIAIDSKPNIKMRTGMVADRTARYFCLEGSTEILRQASSMLRTDMPYCS